MTSRCPVLHGSWYTEQHASDRLLRDPTKQAIQLFPINKYTAIKEHEICLEGGDCGSLEGSHALLHGESTLARPAARRARLLLVQTAPPTVAPHPRPCIFDSLSAYNLPRTKSRPRRYRSTAVHYYLFPRRRTSDVVL